MKKTAIILLLILASAVNVYANDIDKKMESLLSELAVKYVEKHPAGVSKYGLIILPFEEKSAYAEKHSLGETVREGISRVTVRSNVFFLIDRETLSLSMKELELSMSGVVNDNEMVKAGNLAGAKVFLRGTITEEGGKFVITARLVDIETGVVAVIAKTEIESDALIEKQRQFAYEYIAQYGLGINTQFSLVPHITSPRDGAFGSAIDVFVNYRPYLWLNFKLGVTYFSMTYTAEENGFATQMYPLCSTHSGVSNYGSFENYGFHAKNADISEVGPYIGLDYNWTPYQFFTIGFGLSMSMITPNIINVYNNGWVWIDDDDDPENNTASNGTLKQINGFIIEQQMEPVAMFRFEIKPQLFISPRFTIGLYLAYMYSTPMKVSRTTINSEYTISKQFSPNEEMHQKYMGLNANTYGINHNVEDVKLNSMMYGLSFNFYF